MSKEKDELYKILEDIDHSKVGPIEFTTEEYHKLKEELKPTGARLGVYVIPPKNKGSKK
jgi:hypothetical protein